MTLTTIALNLLLRFRPGKAKESILQQLALAKVTTEREVFYGVIDRKDMNRLRLACVFLSETALVDVAIEDGR